MYGSVDDLDRNMMLRTIALAIRSGMAGEYPHGVLLCRGGGVIAESTNLVAREHDVTRHAETVAISQAQKALGTISLSDCVMYASSEPCVYCSYAIRESRLGRVVYGLHSPHMGGVSRWNVLTDKGLSNRMPEVFDPPPEIIGGFMARETEQALLKASPLVWSFVRKREGNEGVVQGHADADAASIRVRPVRTPTLTIASSPGSMNHGNSGSISTPPDHGRGTPQGASRGVVPQGHHRP